MTVPTEKKKEKMYVLPNIKIPHNLHRDLETIAAARMLTYSAIVRLSLRNYIQLEKNKIKEERKT
jgi:hypothetical protein